MWHQNAEGKEQNSEHFVHLQLYLTFQLLPAQKSFALPFSLPLSSSLYRESITDNPEQFMNCYLHPLSLLLLLTVVANSAETLQNIIMSSKTLEIGFTELLNSFLFLIWFFKIQVSSDFLIWLCCMSFCPDRFWTCGYSTKFDKIKFSKYIKSPTSFVQVGSLVGKTDESKPLYRMKW